VSVLRATISEKDFQETVRTLARLRGWKGYHTHDSRRSEAGFPDLCLVKPPRIILAELKSENGRLSKAQGDWLELLGRCPGVESYVWRPRDWRAIEGVLS
jgi:hypothetical protein